MEPIYSQALLPLIVILSTILITFYLLKKYRFNHFNHHQHVKILHMSHLGPKEKIVLLAVDDTQLLIGATSTQIATLYVFPPPTSTAKSQPTYQDIAKLSAAELG